MNNTLKYLIANTIYGTISLLLHFISFNSEFVVLCRGIIGSIFIICIMLINKDLPDFKSIRQNLGLLIISGAALGINWVALFAGYRYGTIVTSLCNYMAPIIVTIISALFLNEKLNYKNVIYIIMAFAGIIFVSGVLETKNEVDLRCLLYGSIAAIGFVILVLANRKLKNLKPLDKTVSQLMVSALVVLPYVIYNNGFPKVVDSRSMILVIIMGIVHTGIAYILYFNSIDVLPIHKVTIIGYMEPVFTIIIGVLIFKESISMLGIIGATLIIAAAMLNELNNK